MNLSMEREAGGRVAGVDEVGRGPLAGPVVAAAVVFCPVRFGGRLPRAFRAINDSKALTPGQRGLAYAMLRQTPGITIGVGAASVSEILRLNILHAAMLAMARAVARLAEAPDHILVDGDRPPPIARPMTCVIGGDARCLSIAAASIVAKVTRDRAMARLHARHPSYGWDGNAGYGTAAHRRALATHGLTPHHRTAFGAVRLLLAERALAAAE